MGNSNSNQTFLLIFRISFSLQAASLPDRSAAPQTSIVLIFRVTNFDAVILGPK